MTREEVAQMCRSGLKVATIIGVYESRSTKITKAGVQMIRMWHEEETYLMELERERDKARDFERDRERERDAEMTQAVKPKKETKSKNEKR